MKRLFPVAFALLTSLVTAIGSANAQGIWKNAQITAGSGFVTDIVAQPKIPGLFYLRTDVGGCYRWDPANQSWTAITDFLSIDKREDYSVEAIAIDPSKPNAVYIACGGTLWESWRPDSGGTIYQSLDRGETWKVIGPKGVKILGNDDMRWGGERLAVQPGGTGVILFGSRSRRLWRTTDGGKHWSVANLAVPKKDNGGVQAVAFDPKTPTTVYAAVEDEGIFKSNDSGSTWTNISTSIAKAERLTVAQNGTVWVTYSNGVAKFTDGIWKDVTPKGAASDAYCGLAVNPRDADNVIVSYGLWGDKSPTGMFQTFNAGDSWTRLYETVTTDVSWYHALSPGKGPGVVTDFLYTPISNFAFDPNKSGSVWFASAGGVYHTPDINRTGGPRFQQVDKGHEELCVTALVAPPAGPELIAGVMDVDGFVFDRGLAQYPSRVFAVKNGKSGATAAIAYEASRPRDMVRLCATEGIWDWPTQLATSSDGGYVWRLDKTFPTKAPSGRKSIFLPLAVAMSAKHADDIVAGVIDSVSRRAYWFVKTRNGGPWRQCNGLPDFPGPSRETIPLASDPVKTGVFYAFVGGAIYQSSDGGRSFRKAGAAPAGLASSARFFKLAPQPKASGNLWLSGDADSSRDRSDTRPTWEGLYHSVNSGKTWTKLAGISRAVIFAFGKPSSNGAPTMFLYGRCTGDEIDRIFRSIDLGKRWTVISNPGQTIGDGPWEMEGSRQTFGRVFIGTYGRGIFYNRAATTRQAGGRVGRGVQFSR